jgi:RHS repeat-associated protein
MVDVLAGNMYYYGNDKLGTPQIMTDSTNTVVWEADYKPFGEADVNPNSSVVNNFRFPGQYYDVETGLHYNYNRYYDPSTGRYLTPDPIGLRGGLNLFAYVLNNPVNMIDPEGLKCGSWWNDWLVSDKPGEFDFSACCQQHDECYGKECSKKKAQCDDEFYTCMKRVCDRKYFSNKKCYNEASKYWNAVDRMGNGAFEDAREDKPCCQK